MTKSPKNRASKKKQVNWEWSAEEDAALLNACGELGGQWSEIGKIISRNKDDCAMRWSLIMPQDWKSFHTLEWADDDILRLIQAVRSTQFDIEKKSFVPSKNCDWTVVAAILNTNEWRWDADDCEKAWCQLQTFPPFRLGSFTELEDVIIAERVLGWGSDQHGLWSWLGNVLKRDHTALRYRWKLIGKQFAGQQSVHKEIISEPHLHGDALLFPSEGCDDEDTEPQNSLWSQQNTPLFTSPANLSTSLQGCTPTSLPTPSPSPFEPSSDTEQNTVAMRKTPKRLHPASASAESARSPLDHQTDLSCFSSYSDHESPAVRRVRQRTHQDSVDLTGMTTEKEEVQEVERLLVEYTMHESQRASQRETGSLLACPSPVTAGVSATTPPPPRPGTPPPALPASPALSTVRSPPRFPHTPPDPDRLRVDAVLARAARTLSRIEGEEELHRALAASLAAQDPLTLPPELETDFPPPGTAHDSRYLPVRSSASLRYTAPAPAPAPAPVSALVPVFVPVSVPDASSSVDCSMNNSALVVDVSALTEEEAIELAVQRSLSESSGGRSSCGGGSFMSAGASSQGPSTSSSSSNSSSGSSNYFSPLRMPHTSRPHSHHSSTPFCPTNTSHVPYTGTVPAPEEVLSFDGAEVAVEQLVLEQQMLEEALALYLQHQHHHQQQQGQQQGQQEPESGAEEDVSSGTSVVSGSHDVGSGEGSSVDGGMRIGDVIGGVKKNDVCGTSAQGAAPRTLFGSGESGGSGGAVSSSVGSRLDLGVGDGCEAGGINRSCIFGSAYLTPHTTAHTTTQSTIFGTSRSHPAVGEVEQQVRAIYTLHNPAKLSSVPELMVKYRGREDVLLTKLRDKYGVCT